MTKNELIRKIENGRDIMFDVLDKHFTILTWTDNGIAIGEQNKPEKPLTYYATARELVDNYLIGGVVLGDVVSKIIITDYT